MIRDVRRLGAASGFLAVALVSAAAAQDFNWFRGGRFRGPDPRVPTATSFDGYFNFCRGMYYSNRREPGGQGWWTDYPAADVNFSIRLSELTKTRVSRTGDHEPNHLVDLREQFLPGNDAESCPRHPRAKLRHHAGQLRPVVESHVDGGDAGPKGEQRLCGG